MSGSDANRRFREQVPQPSASDACPNYCHSETFRQRRHRMLLDGVLEPAADPSAGSLMPFRPTFSRSRNPLLGLEDPPAFPSSTGSERRPWSDTGALSGYYATGDGPVFEALRILDPQAGTSQGVKLQWESQNFHAAATDWEKRYSPLIHRSRRSALTVVVDREGYVVGYSGTADPSRLWRTPDRTLLLLPDTSGTTVSAAARELTRRGWQSLGGGDYAVMLVDIEGQVLSHSIQDRALTEPDFWPSLIFSLGGSLLYGLARSGLRTLATRVTTRSAVRAAPAPSLLKGLAKQGRFAQGGGQKISLYHGTTHTGRVAIEQKGLTLRVGAGVTDDFGDGFYMTLDSQVAQKTSAVHTFPKAGSGQPTTTAVMQVELEAKSLGKIVDIIEDGMHRELWERYLDEPLYDGVSQSVGWAFETAQDRGRLFERSLAKHGLQEADTIIGPLGDRFTSGLASLGDRVSNQVCLRNQAVLDRVSAIIRGQ